MNKIHAVRGVRQGCSLFPLLFDLCLDNDN